MASRADVDAAAFTRLTRAVAAVTLEEARRGALAIAENIMTEAKRLCPVETGALRGSGLVRLAEAETGRLIVTLGFGGPAAPYAGIVHERLDVRHRPPTQAKFLEVPVNHAAPTIPAELAARIRRGLQRRGWV